MIHFENKSSYDLYDLEKLIALLRHPGGCPWDAEQTHESLRRNMLEEAYEAVEAIDEGDPDHLREELGDVLTQVVFHAGIEQDEGRFCLDDVADAVCRKLIFRHPHVFGSEDIRTSDGVLAMWDEIKKVEKKQDSVTDTLHSVARSLPALWRAEKLQKKAAKAVDAPPMDVWDAMDILADRMIGLSDAVSGQKDAEQAFGDVLFSLVNTARLAGIDPELALTGSSDRFTERFAEMERDAGGAPLTADQGNILFGGTADDSKDP